MLTIGPETMSITVCITAVQYIQRRNRLSGKVVAAANSRPIHGLLDDVVVRRRLDHVVTSLADQTISNDAGTPDESTA